MIINASIKLPAPQKDLSFPLMKALENRRSIRKWKETPISEQELSNLLWAACGETKAGTKHSKSKRTAPSACNSQAISLYLALSEGVFYFDEQQHQLIKISNKDIRNKIGTQKMMHSAPLGLIYVSDFSKMTHFLFRDDRQRWFMSATDTAYISQNIYLYCAARNLSTVVLGLVNRDKIHEAIGLKAYQKVVFTQVVGYSIER